MVNIVKIGIPILLIGLGTLDFSKAIFSGKEDDMKKNQEKFIKRIIISVCIFLGLIIVGFVVVVGGRVFFVRVEGFDNLAHERVADNILFAKLNDADALDIV